MLFDEFANKAGGLCAAEALVSTPLTFTSGTLLWASQANFRLFDVTTGGNLSAAAEVAWGTGYQNGQLAFNSDLTTGYMTGASSRRILRITPGSLTTTTLATLTSAAYGVVVTPGGKIYASSADGKVYDGGSAKTRGNYLQKAWLGAG